MATQAASRMEAGGTHIAVLLLSGEGCKGKLFVIASSKKQLDGGEEGVGEPGSYLPASHSSAAAAASETATRPPSPLPPFWRGSAQSPGPAVMLPAARQLVTAERSAGGSYVQAEACTYW